ncbi:MAG: hypothetical protein M0Z50_14125 [Planctomycetia bacterium]|nr:hypothetical protein [Planctomycetia bacterium]
MNEKHVMKASEEYWAIAVFSAIIFIVFFGPGMFLDSRFPLLATLFYIGVTVAFWISAVIAKKRESKNMKQEIQ